MRSTTPESRCPPSGPGDEEGVLHLAGRVVGREVQGVEVEPLGLDLGALGDLVAHGDEDVGDAAPPSVVSGCRAPRGRAVLGQRDVDGLLDQDPRVALGLQLGLAGGERLR